jgi:hypothetical protein
MRYTLCLRYNTLCTGRPSLGAKFGLADDFPPNIFPMTPSGNGNKGRGSRDLSESGYKVGGNSPQLGKIAGKF